MFHLSKEYSFLKAIVRDLKWVRSENIQLKGDPVKNARAEAYSAITEKEKTRKSRRNA